MVGSSVVLTDGSWPLTFAALAGGALWRQVRRAIPFRRPFRRLATRDAYRLWSETYDAQPGNVIFALEQEIFTRLLSDAALRDKVVVDIGCGTGRHWSELLAGRPRRLHGVDSSPEMLARLRRRYPDASLHLRFGRTLESLPDGSVDLVVSTLMLGHVREVAGELREWHRLLRPGGEIVATDFHPEACQAGMKRTFTHVDTTFEVENHPHALEGLRSLFRSLDLEIERFEERAMDPAIGTGVERRGRGQADRRDRGTPLVFGFRVRKAG